MLTDSKAGANSATRNLRSSQWHLHVWFLLFAFLFRNTSSVRDVLWCPSLLTAVADMHARSDRRDRMCLVAVPLEVLMIDDEQSRRNLESSVWTYPRDSFELMELMKSLDHGLRENVLAFEYFQDTGHRRNFAQPSTTLSLCAFKN